MERKSKISCAQKRRIRFRVHVALKPRCTNIIIRLLTPKVQFIAQNHCIRLMDEYMGVVRQTPIDHRINHHPIIRSHTVHPFGFYSDHACTREEVLIRTEIDSSRGKQRKSLSSKTTTTLPQRDNFQIS